MTNEEVLKLIEDGRIIPIQIKANDEETSKYNLENLEALNMIIKVLKQEDILDKIRTEIEELQMYKGLYDIYINRDHVLEIIDKYRTDRSNEE